MAGNPRKKFGVELRGEEYYLAAVERIGCLRQLYDTKRYVEAIYFAGVSVECIFRAFIRQSSSGIDAGHDLVRLAKESRLATKIDQSLYDQYSANLGTVAAVWTNLHIYRSESGARARIKSARLNAGIKGDFLKEQTRRVVNASIELVNLGAAQWTRSD